MTLTLVWWRFLAFVLARYELIPAPDGSRYLSRWHFPEWLARRYDASYLFLHHFHTSDPDRGWHCHPWEWCESRLLAGRYVQELRLRACGFTVYGVFKTGDVNRLGADFHRVRLYKVPVTGVGLCEEPGPWTLFRAGPKHGESWGFIDEAGNYTPANKE